MHVISLPQKRVHDTQAPISQEPQTGMPQPRGWVRLVERLASGVFAGLAIEPRPPELEDELRI